MAEKKNTPPAEESKLFRKTAMDRLSSPEQLDKLLIVVSPKGWIGLTCLLILLFGAIIWLSTATIPVQISVKGIVSNPEGLYAVHPQTAGVVSQILVTKGQKIEKGDKLAIITQPKIALGIKEKQKEIDLVQQEVDRLAKDSSNGNEKNLVDFKLKLDELQNSLLALQEEESHLVVISPVAGLVDRLEANLGSTVAPTEALMIILLALNPNEHLQIYGFINLEYHNRIVAGMPAEIEFLTFDPNLRKTFIGKVAHVSPSALSKPEILQRFGHLERFKFLAPDDTPLLELQVDPGNTTGLASGDFCMIKITTMRKKMIDYLFP